MNVAFDLDGTLIAVDSAQSWLEFVCKLPLPYAEAASAECHAIVQSYDSGTMDMAAYMSSWLKPLKGMPLDNAKHLADYFLHDVIVPQFYPEALFRLKWHQQRGDSILLISASPELIIKPIARHLKISEVIGIRTEIRDHKITGTAIAPFSFRNGKVTAIQQWLSQNGQNSLHLAYSDSTNDLPMLELADNACCINPAKPLLQHATAKNWEICYWQLSPTTEKIL